MRVGRQYVVAKRQYPWQVHAVPIDRRRRLDAIKTAVQAGAEVDDYRVGMSCDICADPVVARNAVWHTTLVCTPRPAKS